MVIIETPLFTRIISDLMSDDAYRELQDALIRQPDKGDLIPGAGGLLKVCWEREGQGQRGGVRMIYYWVVANEQLRMLYAYVKSQQENLTPDQLAVLRKIVESTVRRISTVGRVTTVRRISTVGRVTTVRRISTVGRVSAA